MALLFVVLEKQDYSLPVPPAISQLATGEAPTSTTEAEIKLETPAVSIPEPPKVSIAPPQVIISPSYSYLTLRILDKFVTILIYVFSEYKSTYCFKQYCRQCQYCYHYFYSDVK